MLRITKDAEKQPLKFAGSTIYYTPIGWGEFQALRKRHRNPDNLLVDHIGLDCAIVDAHTVAWDNVKDAAGEPISFSLEAFWHLSPMIVQTVHAAIMAGVREETGEAENSESSSDT